VMNAKLPKSWSDMGAGSLAPFPTSVISKLQKFDCLQVPRSPTPPLTTTSEARTRSEVCCSNAGIRHRDGHHHVRSQRPSLVCATTRRAYATRRC
jgi:hypothetical protein